MESPIEILKEEHEVIKKGLGMLEIFLKLGTKKVLNSDVKELLNFFNRFADKCHHVKEENSLFPLAEKRGIPKENGPIGVMLFEHEEGRKLRKAMMQASKDLEKNFEEFARNGRNFVILLKEHIEKENNILFPMVNSVLNTKDKEELLKEFEEIEEKTGKNVHERYVEFIKILIKKYSL